MKDITGIILAGGQSSRFGSPKAFAAYDGRFFYEHAANALLPHVKEIIIVSSIKDAARFKQKERVKIISDIEKYKGKGPLAGIYSAMSEADSSWYFVLPCDMPLMDQDAVGTIAAFRDEGYDAVIPEADGRFQPLAGLYNRRIKNELQNHLDSGSYRMISLLYSIKPLMIKEDQHHLNPDVFQNINDRAALRQMIERRK